MMINGDPYILVGKRWTPVNPGTQTRLAVYYNEFDGDYRIDETELAYIDYFLDGKTPLAPDMIGHAKTQEEADKLIRQHQQEQMEYQIAHDGGIPF